MSYLTVQSLSVSYGAIMAARGVSLSIKEGETVALIGSNGAGKSSTLNAIAGLIGHTGKVGFDGIDMSSFPVHKRAAKGLALVPEGRGVLGRLTVDENLRMGAYLRADRKSIAEDLMRIYELFPRLRERRGQTGGTLSGGEQQMLAIGRALMASPKLLLLDEPSMGLAPLMVEKIFEVIREISSSGVTIFLVEQNARLALESSNRAYVMESGELTMEGDSQELLRSSKVRESYLGEENS